MAWKLKKSKPTADEMPQVDDESPNGSVASSQVDRPNSAGTQDSDYSEFGGTQRTVMLLNDSDYIPGLIPSAPPAHSETPSASDDTDLFPVTSDEELDRYLRGEQTFDPSSVHDSPGHAVDIDASHEHAADAVDLDEPVHVGARIDLDDEPVAAPPIELDNIHIPSGIPFDQLDSLPDSADHEDIAHARGAAALIDLDAVPAESAHVDSIGAHNEPTGIDIDASAEAHGRIELDDTPAHVVSLDADNSQDMRSHAYIDNAIDAVPQAPTSNGTQAPHSIDASDDGSDFYASALTASDAAVESLRSAASDEPPSATAPAQQHPPEGGTHPVGSPAMENWDLDAFAPYQPPGGAAVVPSVDTPSVGLTNVVPAEETLAGATAVSRLIVRLGQFSASYELIKAETTIGRPDPRTSVFPDVAVEWDDAVSRNHCRVLHKGDGDYVEDTGSTNGTRLNDKPIAPYKPMLLSDGDRIGVGEKTEISYLK